MLNSQGCVVDWWWWCTPVFAQKVANFPNGLLNDFRLPRRPLKVRAALLRRSCDGVAAATESLLRRSRCCDGDAQTSSVALILRVASATQPMLLRRSRCCDVDAQTSSVALILRVASRRDALNEEPASFPPGDSNFNSWPTVLGHPPGPVILIIQAGRPKKRPRKGFYLATFFEYNKRLLRQKTGGA